MKRRTVRGEIRSVASRWERQYPREKLDIRAKLRALNVDTATAGDVEAIIGNGSWTRLFCHECGYDVEHDSVVVVGEEPDYESATAQLCERHLREALALFTDAEVFK